MKESGQSAFGTIRWKSDASEIGAQADIFPALHYYRPVRRDGEAQRDAIRTYLYTGM